MLVSYRGSIYIYRASFLARFRAPLLEARFKARFWGPVFGSFSRLAALLCRPACNPSPRRYSSSGGHSRRKMNALTFSCIRQPSSSCSPAPGESSSRRCSSQSRWASRGCFTRRRTSRYAAMDTHRPWSGALLTLEGGRPCLEGPRAG